MKILCFSDTQASWHNLDKCQKTVRHIIQICQQHSISHVVHNGDVKDAYNPIDLRLVNWAVAMVQQFKTAGIKIYVNLGNHDKVGMHDSTADWFPALQAAGAWTTSVPCFTRTQNHNLFFLPYSRSNDYLREALKKFAADADPQNSILFFHSDIAGSRHNQITKSHGGEDCLSLKDLHRDKYLFCLGGHIHMRQRLASNVWYLGSAFACDWGEANQVKGFTIIDTQRRKLQFIKSRVPGLYDPAWPGFDESSPKNWKGSTVRVHIPCDSSVHNLGSFLEKARVRGEKDYPGANIIIDPEFSDAVPDFKLVEGGDPEIVAAYVESHCPESMTAQKAAAIPYLLGKLEAVAYLRRSHGFVEFQRARAANFLSYKELDILYSTPGICVISGKNEDWPGKSNGAGKTSYLQPPPVALFGRTLKGQSHDRWARRNAKDTSKVSQTMRLPGGKICKIIRTRKPVKLKVTLDGKDISTGRGVKDTQKVIEHVTGLTWDVLVNSIYISQSDVARILTGSDTERQQIFSQFLRLERFKLARDLIAADIRKAVAYMGEVEQAGKSYAERIQQVQRFWEDLPKPIKLGNAGERLKKLKGLLRKQHRKAAHLKNLLEEANAANNTTVKELHDACQFEQEAVYTARGIAENASRQISRMKHVSSQCPMCRQHVSPQWIRKQIQQFEVESSENLNTAVVHSSKHSKLAKRLREFESAVEYAKHKQALCYADSKRLASEIEVLHARRLEAIRNRKLTQKYKRERVRLRYLLYATSQASISIRSDIEFYKFCLETFSKDGLPAFLAYQLCPQLNKAAKKYARLFSEGQIHVQFTQDAEDIGVLVLNPKGGEGMEDQSQGEARIASLTVIFALREVTRLCNLLILDEPGEGLDPSNAKVFAKALKEVAKSFGTVLVTTHNPHISAELADERQVVIVKRNGVSRVQLGSV